jgi:DNA-binding NtrC family response regulator
MALLMEHPWPGNVRELRNVLERAVVVASGSSIQAPDLGLLEAARGEAAAGDMTTLEQVERRHIAHVLAKSGGNITQAARVLDIDRVTLYNKIKKYHLREVESA